MATNITDSVGFGNHAQAPAGVSRREFLAILAALGVSSLVPLAGAEGQGESKKSKPLAPIFGIKDPRMMDEFFTTRPDLIQQNFDLLLAAAGGSSEPRIAWRKWLKPGQRIGIKISTSPGKVMSTRPPVVDAIVSSLLRAGFPARDILIFDRYAAEMSDAGWVTGARDDGVLVTATWPSQGYDPKTYYSCSFAGRLIWGDYEFKGEKWNQPRDDSKDQLSNRSYFSRIVTDKIDALINVPVITSDEWMGLYGSIANVALGVIDNYRRFMRPFFGREENIADLAAHKAVRGKWVLNIVDGLLGQYAGGPPFDPKYDWCQGSLWLSEDAVGLDALALQLINEQRPAANIKPVDPDLSSYIQSCAELGLGSAKLDGDRVRAIALPALDA